jgi:hypothetical protein
VAICHGFFVWSVVNRDSGKRHPAGMPRDFRWHRPCVTCLMRIGKGVFFVRDRREVVMVVLERLQNYLKIHHIPYEEMPHSTAYTAREVAENLHVPAKMFAKVVVVKADGRFVMAVLPGWWI